MFPAKGRVCHGQRARHGILERREANETKTNKQQQQKMNRLC